MGNSLCADKELKKPREYYSKQRISLFYPDHDDHVKSELCDKGQRFTLLDDSFGSWWTMRTQLSDERVIVGTASKYHFYPADSDKEEDKEDWYFGEMLRSEAEELLSHSANDQEAFLVRFSSKHKKLGMIIISDVVINTSCFSVVGEDV